MIIVKFIVFFGCISVLSALQTYFCDICSNHTFCRYQIPGPGAACKNYDSSALLSKQQIEDIVHKINERRNYIALGSSYILPPAANMKKIHWSSELASLAQRWADQCDPSVLPDKEDDCRDLKNSTVGQTIASVTGSSPGLNVKSFVETWFIQVLEYTGIVTYYNQSRDYRTKYFTQLIWAETEFVGCGKVKFYIENKKVTVERLVCNFAPEGNTHGKPVYRVGFAGTQCTEGMVQDNEFKGLCTHKESMTVTKLPGWEPPRTSLLRIMNLSNESMKQEIDPIRSNINQTSLMRKRHRNKKTRHTLSSKRYDALERPPPRKQNMRKTIIHKSGNVNDDYNHQHDRGHSHLYHGDEEPIIINPVTNYFQRNNNQDLRRYDYPTPPIYLITSPDYRVINSNQCTRNAGHNCNDPCKNSLCTRSCHHHTTCCPSETFTNPPNILCPSTLPCFTTCSNMCRPFSTEKHNCNCMSYNNMPNMVRSGNRKGPEVLTSPKSELDQLYQSKFGQTYEYIQETEENNPSPEKKYDDIFHSKNSDKFINLNEPDYLYRHFESRIRKKRQLEDTLKPFWKKNEFHENTPTIPQPQLKSLIYTTFPRIQNRKTRRNKLVVPQSITMEPITIRKEDYATGQVNSENVNDDKTTEKYLSFDELMYLRKFSDNYMGYNPRRQDGRRKDTTMKKKSSPTTQKKIVTTKKKTAPTTKKSAPTTTKKTIPPKVSMKAATPKKLLGSDPTIATTKPTTKATTKAATKATTKPTTPATTRPATTPKAAVPVSASSKANIETSTTEYTANTPFKQKKHCTRKLTCTWTQFTGMITDDNGNPIGPSWTDRGSRTPPGYVEGCTRTSTCTRDFQDRNKMATPSGSGDNVEEAHESISEDDGDEYCEKRSLNIHKRNYNDKETAVGHTSTPSVIDSLFRKKRQDIASLKGDSKIISYSDLYYLVLNKIIKKPHNNKKCPCNCSSFHTILPLLCTFYFLFYLIY